MVFNCRRCDHLWPYRLGPAARRVFEAVGGCSLPPLRRALARCPASEIDARHPSHGGTALHVASGIATDEASLVSLSPYK